MLRRSFLSLLAGLVAWPLAFWQKKQQAAEKFGPPRLPSNPMPKCGCRGTALVEVHRDQHSFTFVAKHPAILATGNLDGSWTFYDHSKCGRA